LEYSRKIQKFGLHLQQNELEGFDHKNIKTWIRFTYYTVIKQEIKCNNTVLIKKLPQAYNQKWTKSLQQIQFY